MKIALFLLGYMIYLLFTGNLPIIETLGLVMIISVIISYIISKSLEDSFKSLINRKR